MQLKFFFLFFALSMAVSLKSQEAAVVSKEEASQREKIKADLLLNYYMQDGDHSPVTAGEGTEDQQVLAPMILLYVPIGKRHVFDLKLGVDNITSASTDQINGTKSSASENDTRVHVNLWYDYNFEDMGQSLGAMVGMSSEYDVKSIQAGFRYSLKSDDENQDFNATFQLFQDRWDLIYPMELRASTNKLLEEDARDSYNLSMTYSRVLTQRSQASITTDFVLQSGLLSTPFHRVEFSDQVVDIERLPDSRSKVAVGLRWNYMWNDFLVTRAYYRFYWDDFEVLGNTFELELPIKIKPNFSVIPVVRYHMQSASKYFKGKGEHDPLSEFHTSDYDLSDLTSLLYGIHLHYVPLNSAFWKHFQIDGLDLRYSYYDRDDGLTAHSISLGFSFSF